MLRRLGLWAWGYDHVGCLLHVLSSHPLQKKSRGSFRIGKVWGSASPGLHGDEMEALGREISEDRSIDSCSSTQLGAQEVGVRLEIWETDLRSCSMPQIKASDLSCLVFFFNTCIWVTHD